MAEANAQQQAGGAKKAGWFNQLYHIARNRVVRFPLIERMMWGRTVVGKKPHPLFDEIKDRWLNINEKLFLTMLGAIEGKWGKQADQLGFEDIKRVQRREGSEIKLDLEFGNPNGIVNLYYKLGVYSDIDRIKTELDWFDHGTGLDIDEVPYRIPLSEDEWKKYGWVPENVRAVLATNPSKPWEKKKMRKFHLRRGVVYHEGKEAYKEELYVIGHHRLDKLKKAVDDHNTEFNFEKLQQSQIPVEIRTKATNLSKALVELFTALERLEHGYYEELRDIFGQIETYTGLRTELLTQLSPESIPHVIIRFPHTYQIIKQKATKTIKEIIIIKDPVTQNVIKRMEKERVVIKNFNFKDIYQEELAELDAKINNTTTKRDGDLRLPNDLMRNLRNILNDPNSFKRELSDLIARNRAAISTALNNPNMNVDEKIEEIRNILRHRDVAIDSLIKELIETMASAIKKIIESRKAVDEKIMSIEAALLSGLKRSIVIEQIISEKASNIKGAINPFGLDEEGHERKKEREEIYYDLELAFSIRYPEIDNFIEKVFEKHKTTIYALIDSLLSAGKNADLNAALQRITKLVTDESRADDNEIGAIQLKIEKLIKEIEEIKKECNKILSEYEERKIEINNLDNRQHILDSLKRESDNFFKRDEELDWGLDEHGYPLEIDNDGIVLIDKWWSQLANNTWQLKKIATKHGGPEMLKRHLNVDVRLICPENKSPDVEDVEIIGTPSRGTIRKITDEDFKGYVDLLDISTAVFGYWDSVRDDLRDGRYHPHTKSIGDYVIEGMGGYDENKMAPYFRVLIPGWRSGGLYFARRGSNPFGKSAIHVSNMKQKMLSATPNDFENVSREEALVTRKYKLRMPEGAIGPDGNPLLFISGTRKASKYDPAFDRRAEQLVLNWVFWGNMYYWRWAGYAKEWSENPFPHISTRGVALYLQYLASIDSYYLQEAADLLGKEGETERKFDYGTRGQGKYPFNNPITGKNVVGPEAEN